MIREDCIALSNLWMSIIKQYNPGVYLFEIEEFPEIENTPDLFNSIFNYMDGYFLEVFDYKDDIQADDVFDFKLIEAYSHNFGLSSGEGKRHLQYIQQDKLNTIEANVVTTDSNDSVIDIINIKDIEQTATRILASLLIPPIIALNLNKKLVGILFKDQSIDIKNLSKVLDFFQFVHSKKEFEDFKIILLSITPTVSRNTLFISDKVNRVGILKNKKFLSTKSFNSCQAIIPTIFGGIKQGQPFVLFLGAGANIDAVTPEGDHLPLGRDLKKIAIKNVVRDRDLKNVNDINDLESHFEDWLLRGPGFLEEETKDNISVTLERVLLEEFVNVAPENSRTLHYLSQLSEDCSIPKSYINIKRIIEKGYKPIIITTNYDRLLERTLDEIEFKSIEEFDQTDKIISKYINNEIEQVPIFKIHGSLSQPVTIQKSVKNIFRLPKPIHNFLESLYCGYLYEKNGSKSIPSFFVGYSFSDKDVNDFYNNPKVQPTIQPYCVNPSPASKMTKTFDPNTPANRDMMLTITFSQFMEILVDSI